MSPPPRDSQNQWEATTYDESHSFVFEYGEDVVSVLQPVDGERILDLGCGTGHLTNSIAEAGAEVVGLDAAEEMIRTARTRYPACQFVRADAREFEFEEPFDAVFSNATLHWIHEQDRVLDSVAGALKPGGRFVGELGGTGNVSAIVTAVQAELEARGYDTTHPWYFPSVGEYATALESHGFEVQYATLFDRPTKLENGTEGLATWLEMFGDDLLSPLSTSEKTAVVGAVEDELRDELLEDGVWSADYRRLRFAAVLTEQ